MGRPHVMRRTLENVPFGRYHLLKGPLLLREGSSGEGARASVWLWRMRIFSI